MFEADLWFWLTICGLILGLLRCCIVYANFFLDVCFGFVDGYSMVQPLPDELKVGVHFG
jgi:hypothetical protein